MAGVEDCTAIPTVALMSPFEETTIEALPTGISPGTSNSMLPAAVLSSGARTPSTDTNAFASTRGSGTPVAWAMDARFVPVTMASPPGDSAGSPPSAETAATCGPFTDG